MLCTGQGGEESFIVEGDKGFLLRRNVGGEFCMGGFVSWSSTPEPYTPEPCTLYNTHV